MSMTLRTRWSLAVGAGLVLFGPGLVQLGRLALEQRRLDRRLAELEQQRAQLAKEQGRLESDPSYMEGLIRSTFKMAQPGELVIPLDAPSSTSAKPLPKNR